ncbi:MAG: TerB family tellurite resistance protein [Aestuariivirga sp.]|nr:TerB family tellurite resistance protein [Aestuariivirga sp.]
MGLFSALFGRNDKYPEIESFEVDSEGYLVDDEQIPDPELVEDPDFRLAGMRVGMIYKDSNGKVTKRIVRLIRIADGYDEGYVTAFCELRQEHRTFLLSRINTLFDPSNGEILAPAFDFFGPYMDEMEAARELKAEKSQFRLVWPIIESLRYEMQILVLVARADNRFVRAEQNTLLRFMTMRAQDMGHLVNDNAQMVLLDWIRLQDPSEPEARLAIKALASRPESLSTIWTVVDLVAEADGKVRPEERATIEEIKETIKKVATESA